MDSEQHAFCPLEPAPTLALIERLQSDRRYRDMHRQFFVEGVRNVVTAADHGFTVDALVYSERLLIAPVARRLVRNLKRAGVPFARVSPEQFRTISQTEQASGVGAVLRQHIRPLPDAGAGCWVALGPVRSLGNLGTLVRTAAATGADGFILLDPAVDPFDPAVVRATMGALFGQRLARATHQEFAHWARRHRVQVVGASPDGPVEYDRLRYSRPTAIMLGEERAGLSEAQRAVCQQLVRIPMVGAVDSLNLAVAGSLLLYEVFRSARSGCDRSDRPRR
ncbi:MAG TPA: RNA methyltransferase [Roseiflexaceae bacterium]|nr:RNA methyltransferase [Roseiflexaceae bacterium]